MSKAAAPTDRISTEQQVLRRMLADAETLCQSADPLICGQYEFLRGRISALIKINEAAAGAETGS